ncbi:MAG: hypothetical protein ACKO9Q_25865, partial [Pirellula sp.]
EQLGAVAQTAPLMATIHDSRETLDHYRSNMMTYRNAASQVLGFDKAKLPLVPLSLAAFGTGLVFLLALGMLDPRKHLSIGAGFVWTASICAAIYSGYRIASARFSVSKATPKLAQIHQYLGIQAKPSSPATKTLAKKLTQGVSAEHVTLQAGNNQKLLDDVSAAFKPGQLTAIISSDPFLSKALVEMILGFGQPVSGRLMFDEVDSKDISSESIRQHCLWIAPNGPLVTGTIEDNLWLGLQRDATVDLREITQLARVSEAVLELPMVCRHSLVSMSNDSRRTSCFVLESLEHSSKSPASLWPRNLWVAKQASRLKRPGRLSKPATIPASFWSYPTDYRRCGQQTKSSCFTTAKSLM